jgi:hypothetical protein
LFQIIILIKLSESLKGLSLFHFFAGLLVIAYPEKFLDTGDESSLVFPIHDVPDFGSRTGKLLSTLNPIKLLFIGKYFTVCLYLRHAYMHTGSYVFPCLSKAAIMWKYLQRKCKILILFSDQDFSLFRMVHLIFL